jgi:hypothetical protein
MNKGLIGAGIAALIIITCFVGSPGSKYSPAKISFANGKFVEMPFKIFGAHTYIRTLVNGQKSIWMVDTGWTEGAIADNLVKGLPGKRICYTDANTHICTKRYNVKGLELLDKNDHPAAKVDQFQAMGLDKKDKFANNQGGTLGFEIFKNYVLKFDYKGNRLTVYDPEYFDKNRDDLTCGFNLVDAEAEGHTFRVDTKVNGISVGKMKLDTGSSFVFLSHKAAQIKEIDALRKNTVRTEGIGFGGDYIKTYFVEAEVEFGGIKIKREVGLPSKPMAFTKGSAGDLGYPALKGLSFIFDYPSSKLYIKK